MRSLLCLLAWIVATPAGAATLDEAWAAAEQGSVELRLAHEQSLQTATYRFQALSQQLPQLTTQWTWLRNQDQIPLPDELLSNNFIFVTQSGDFVPLPEDFVPPDGGSSPIALPNLQELNQATGSVTLLQPILRAGAVPGFQSATSLWRAAQSEEIRVRQQVRAATARVFFGLHTARAAQGVADQSVEIARKQADLAARQVGAGLVARRAELQAQLSLSRAERDSWSAHEQVVSAEQAWRRVTGTDAPATLELPEPFEVPEQVDDDDGTTGQLRPDLSAAVSRERAARREHLARDLEWAPTIDFFFREDLNIIPTALSPRVDQWRLGFRLDWQIFDGGLRIARSRELASRTRAASLVVEQRQRQVREEVTTAWARLERAERALAAVEDELGLAEENLLLAESGFEGGSATFLDVEMARVGLASSRLAEITERSNREMAAVDLLLAMGRL